MHAAKHDRSEQPLSDTAVVLVHGLWMPGWIMALLAWRLRRAGAVTRLFHYSSRRTAIGRNAAALAALVEEVPAPVVHFVGHSLGGLVVIRMLLECPAQRPGRVVLLGTPYQGSGLARRLSVHGWVRWWCGLSLQEALLGDGPPWTGGREVGVIAGTFPLGLGTLVRQIPPPHDGMVTVAETEMPGRTDMITLPVAHSGMLFSRPVARQVAAFLAEGRFERQRGKS